MKYKILGWIGIVWGAAILAGGTKQLLNGEFAGGAYGAGQVFSLVFGVLLVYAGIRALKKAG